ncbi:MAG: integrase [Thermosipho sp. (in: Bacteria)]|nr:integrase [Thermosipho sp. (in: thermotogales)]
MFEWDKNVDFEDMRKKLENEIRSLRKKNGTNADKQLCYNIILYIQLLNGCRIGEAVRAIKQLSQKFERKIRVRVEKRKNEYERLIIVPKLIKVGDIRRIKWIIDSADEETLKKRVKVWCRKRWGINTHALRYAFISHLALQGVSAQLIAKITGHAKLDYILYYTQKQKAEQILESLMS